MNKEEKKKYEKLRKEMKEELKKFLVLIGKATEVRDSCKDIRELELLSKQVVVISAYANYTSGACDVLGTVLGDPKVHFKFKKVDEGIFDGYDKPMMAVS